MVEPNTFGTDEFMFLCEAVGAEPMLCVNAGSGTSRQAAQWVEYCNLPKKTTFTEMRARNGHPEPYGVKFWQIGNQDWHAWESAPDCYPEEV